MLPVLLASKKKELLPSSQPAGKRRATDEQERSIDSAGASPRHHEPIEVVTLKRLNYLRGTLDTHDPRETRVRLRLSAQQKRD